MPKKFLFLFLLFTAFTLNAAVKYSSFIDKQLQLVQEMDDTNLTKEKVFSIVSMQKEMYEKQLNLLMANKDDYLKGFRDYQSEIFSLKKIITINKREGNTYAVLRDEVQVKSYEIVKNQYMLIKGALLALRLPNIDLYGKKLNQLVVEEQNRLIKINKVDYHKYLDINNTGSLVVKKLQNNIRDFYNLEDINSDFISYLYKFKNKMYRLNKYSKYHIIKLVIYLQSFELVRDLDALLESFGLSIIKIFLILTMTLIIYLFRKIIYVFIQKSFSKFDFLAKYSDVILEKLKKAIESLVIIININIVLYIYNDFSSGEILSRVFNIIYGLYFTVIIYIFINAVASIKINSFNTSSKQIKNELINVGMKIINFIIIIIGLLIALYLAGVDLTTVLSGLGIGGFAVAFAAKDTISNFFGTLSVLFSEVFSQGDWIEIDGKEGVVVEIGLRVTTLRTFDNALIAIPNGIFAAKEIKNWNKRKLGRRIKMSIGVKYDSKKEDIVNAVNEIREMLSTHPDIATENTEYKYTDLRHSVKLVSKADLQGIKKTLLVYLDEFDSSSINILVYCFSKSVDWEDWLATKQDVMENIMDILAKNSLEFAFPSLSIYHENEVPKIS